MEFGLFLPLPKALTAPAHAVDDPLAHGAPGATILDCLRTNRVTNPKKRPKQQTQR